MNKVLLKKFTEKNINDKYIKWMNDYQVIKYLGREDYFSGFDFNMAISYYNKMIEDKKVKFYSIYYENEYIGTAKSTLINENPKNKISEIGILIGEKNFWGRGIASTTIKILSKHLFEDGNRKIIAGGFKDKTGMIRAFINSGFKVEANFRESIFNQNNYYDHIYLGCFNKELIDIQ